MQRLESLKRLSGSNSSELRGNENLDEFPSESVTIHAKSLDSKEIISGILCRGISTNVWPSVWRLEFDNLSV